MSVFWWGIAMIFAIIGTWTASRDEWSIAMFCSVVAIGAFVKSAAADICAKLDASERAERTRATNKI